MKLEKLYDKEAERAIIGQVLLDNKVFDEANLSSTHFFDPKHAGIWRGFKDLQSRGLTLEPVALGEYLSGKGLLRSCGGLSYIGELVVAAPVTSANATHYCSIIRNDSLKRDIMKLPGVLKQGNLSGEEQLVKLRTEIDRLEANISRGLPTMQDVLVQEVADIYHDVESGIKNPYGLLTGLGIERIVPGGVPTDKVMFLFAESGNFKTTTKDNLIWGIAKHAKGGTVLDCTLEDSNELAAQRYLSKTIGISYGKIAVRDLEPSVLPKLKTYNKDIASRIIMGGDINPCADDIIRQARYYKRTTGLVAVFVDYIQLLEGADDHKRLASDVKKFQRSGKRDKIAYILLSQVKADVDDRAKRKESTRPRISDMIGSSQMRFAGKVSIGLYRPHNYEKVPRKGTTYYNLYIQQPEVYPHVLEMCFVKNVLGEPHVTLPCIVTPETGQMVPMPIELKELLV